MLERERSIRLVVRQVEVAAERYEAHGDSVDEELEMVCRYDCILPGGKDQP